MPATALTGSSPRDPLTPLSSTALVCAASICLLTHADRGHPAWRQSYCAISSALSPANFASTAAAP